MIKTYKEEVISRRNKAAVFWFIVFLQSCILYLFFQWYYVNVDFKINKWVNSNNLFKQFWIISVHVFPNPQYIFLNKWAEKLQYNNSDKKTLDYWLYNISMYSSWYIPSIIDVRIDEENQIFYETINLFKIPKYQKFNGTFDDIKKVGDNYLLFSKNNNIVQVMNSNFKYLNAFLNNYIYIWYKYFSNNWVIYVYDFNLNILRPYISSETSFWVICNNAKTFHDRLFCYDNMDFIDWSEMKWNEKVLLINDNLILTKSYIYNNGNWWNWWTYNHSNSYIYDPTNLVHINNMPYFLEDSKLYSLEDTTKTQFVIKELKTIKNSYEFANETLLLWYNWIEWGFVLIDDKRKYVWKLNNIDIGKVTVYKLEWVYFFNTPNNLYIYYKWSPKLFSILSWEDIKLINNVVFFKKDWKNYTFKLD